MTFAQRSVAGEEETRLQNYPTPSPTLVAPAPKRLKRKTIEAVERATRIGGLGRSARSALAALARTANNDDPNGKIFKHRETLCTETGMSPATWYRAQKELLGLGLITVDVQVRKRFGRFAGAYIYLTEKATTLLGLTPGEEDAPNSANDERSPSVEADGSTPVSAAQPSLKTRVPFTVDRFPYSFQKRQQGRLPEDLTCLRALGLDANLIFWMMRKAKEQGHFLSHVVQATWSSLAKAKEPKAYLLALLHARTDYSGICKAKADQDRQERMRSQERDFVRSVLAVAARQRFMDGQGNEFEVESDGQSVLVTTPVGVRSRVVGSSLAAFAKRLDAGAYKKVEAWIGPTHSVVEVGKLSEKGASTLSKLRAMMGIRRERDASCTSGAIA